MDRNWNVRLKKAREQAGLTLKEVSSMNVFDVSQQSLIKYENGQVFPKIDLLDKMCKKYNVTVDYILYGSSELSKTNSVEGQLVSLFMLLYSKKITFNKEGEQLQINDKKLLSQINALNTYIKQKDISSTEDLFNLIRAIKIMSEE